MRPQLSAAALGLALAVTAALPGPAHATTTSTVITTSTALTTTAALTGAAQGGTKATPRNFTGYGFDQCVTPSQSMMDAWLNHSPFWAVGIYISGASRACRVQTNQTPTWITTQLNNGWRILPITLGPQASCSDRFPRYGNDPTINSSSASKYRKARKQGRSEAVTAVAEADRLGISAGSTLWYDLEAFDITKTDCRESALAFTSAWTNKLHTLGYVSGFYSSAASGIKMLDDVRRTRPTAYTLPDRIWLARWDGVANTSSSYISEDGWRPGNRMKQYLGGHNETHGGVTINIDSNFLDLGKGSVAKPEKTPCSGTNLSFQNYPVVRLGSTVPQVRAGQCLLRRAGVYSGEMTGTADAPTMDAVAAWRRSNGFSNKRILGKGMWVALHANVTSSRVIKYGAAGERVRRLQRALNASGASSPVDGVFGSATTADTKTYQRAVGQSATGVVNANVWKALRAGRS